MHFVLFGFKDTLEKIIIVLHSAANVAKHQQLQGTQKQAARHTLSHAQVQACICARGQNASSSSQGDLIPRDPGEGAAPSRRTKANNAGLQNFNKASPKGENRDTGLPGTGTGKVGIVPGQ